MRSIRNIKLNKKLAACAVAGTIGLSLAAATAPASAAVQPAGAAYNRVTTAVRPDGAYNSTVTNTWSLQTLIGTAFSTTLQTNTGWNGSIVQFNWLSHYENIAPWEAAVYMPSWSSFGHYYPGANSLVDWGNYSFIVSDGDGVKFYCVYMRTITNNAGYMYTQDWDQINSFVGGKC
jgi:hypothetical protein